MLPNDILQKLMTALHPQHLTFYNAVVLLSRIKNNSLHILVQQKSARLYASKKYFLRFHESIFCLVQFLNNQAASCFIICLYANCIRNASRLCDYIFFLKIVKNGRRSLLGSIFHACVGQQHFAKIEETYDSSTVCYCATNLENIKVYKLSISIQSMVF